MAAVKPRGSTSGKKVTSTSMAVTLPAGTASGDFAVMVCQANVSTATWETPPGWTLLAESELKTENGGARSVAIFTRKLTGATGENLPTIKASVSSSIGYSIQVAEAGTYDTTNPIDTHSAWKENVAAEATEVTAKDGTTGVAGDLIMLIMSESGKSENVTHYTLQQQGAPSTYHWTNEEEVASGVELKATYVKASKAVYQVFFVAFKAIAEEGAAVGHQVMVV